MEDNPCGDVLIQSELASARRGLNFLASQADATNKSKGFQEYEEDIVWLRRLASRPHLHEGEFERLQKIADDYQRAVYMQKLFLAMGELAEAGEDLREEDTDWAHYGEELADNIIRVIGHAHAIGLNIGERVVTKMERNKNRPFKHGKAA